MRMPRRRSARPAPVLDRELLEDAVLGERHLAAAVLVAAESPAESVRTFQNFLEMIEHHRAAERRGERGDEEAVKAPRIRAADRAGCVAAEGVRDQPFASEELVARVAALPAGLNRDCNVASEVLIAVQTVSCASYACGCRGRSLCAVCETKRQHETLCDF